MLVDDGVLIPGDGHAAAGELTAIAVPPTIQALLAARLDRPRPLERAVLEAASVEGKEFARERVAALVERRGRLDRRPAARARPQGPDPARRRRAQTFRFRHQLIRDAAYEGMPKELRADLHERFADWLEARPSVFPVADELLGHHLERAVRAAARARRDRGGDRGACARGVRRISAPPACAPPSATIRRPRARCSERAIALAEPDDVARGALLPGPRRRRSSRPAA